MAGKNQPPEEWTRLMREARNEARAESIAQQTKFPKLFIVVMVIGFVIVGFLIWLKGQVDQAAMAPRPFEKKVVVSEKDVRPRIYAPPVEESESELESPHRVMPPANGGLDLPGGGGIHFDPPAKAAEGNEE